MSTEPRTQTPDGRKAVELEFTQYLMPDGRATLVTGMALDPDGKTAEAAKALRDRGLVFEVEMLSDYNTVSITVTDRWGDDGDIDCELAPNGPGIPAAIRRLLLRAAGMTEEVPVP